jgi:carbonic anhydrase
MMQDKLLEKTRQYRQTYWEANRDALNTLVKDGQKPNALFISCADSRIMPESILGLNPGDFFMLRNVANIVPPYVQTEIGIVSSLEFAVLNLHVPDIIVCGHTQCGGIISLDEHIDMGVSPALSRWIDVARPAQRDVDFSMRGLSTEERHSAIVEQNVINQLRNIASYPFIQIRMDAGMLNLHGWVYYMERHQIGYYDALSGQFVISS